MKILYLTLLHNGKINGGYTYRMMISKAMKNVIGYENLDIVLPEDVKNDWGCHVIMYLKNYTSGKEKVKNLLQGNITQRSNKDIDKIIKLINKNGYDIVVFGDSETGKLIKKIKKYCNVKTITIYNDIVADVISREKKKSIDIKKILIWRAEINAEKLDSRLTDIPVVLHQRDANLLYKYWRRRTNEFMPIALEDKFVPYDFKENTSITDTLQMLFVGSYNWTVNIEAVKWFCENVLAKLNNYCVCFNIAGYEMEKLLEEDWILKYKNVNVIGTVDDLSEVYKEADLVVEPIINGSGMKVKTAEALMFGKEIIGTYEALVGYDELVDSICETAEDFINAIIYYIKKRPQKFVNKNRIAYENNYSLKGLEHKIEKILENEFIRGKNDKRSTSK